MNNIDILWIHNFLVRKYNLTDEAKTESEYEKWKTLYEDVSVQASPELLEDIRKNMSETEKIQDSEQFHFYLIHAIPILDEYKGLQSRQSKIDFMSSQADNAKKTVNEMTIRQRMNALLKDYFWLVQTYFPTEYKKNDWDKIRVTSAAAGTAAVSSRCPVCSTDYDHFILHDNHSVCEKCGFVAATTHNSVSYRDIDRVNMSSKYTYDRRSHFRDTIAQYQGKQNASIPKQVYDDLIHQLVSHRIVPEEHATMPKEVAFEKVTREHILIFLREIHQTKHYEDVVLIHHTLTGRPAPDISHLENDLMNDFNILVETYDKKYKTSERKNFINTQYVLFQLLRRHRFPCKKEDFNMLKTVDRKYFHDQVCSELFAEIGWSFTALF
ncbi:hypothetical protein EBZ80_01065 [bacterium]|nr:hypothetical protein [bacterium]